MSRLPADIIRAYMFADQSGDVIRARLRHATSVVVLKCEEEWGANLTATDCRALAAWLLQAADALDDQNPITNDARGAA